MISLLLPIKVTVCYLLFAPEMQPEQMARSIKQLHASPRHIGMEQR